MNNAERAITIIDGAGIDDQAACCVGESGTCNRMPLVLETRRVIRVGGEKYIEGRAVDDLRVEPA